MSVSCEGRVLSGAASRSLVQRSPIECGVSECDRGISYRKVRITVAVKP